MCLVPLAVHKFFLQCCWLVTLREGEGGTEQLRKRFMVEFEE